MMNGLGYPLYVNGKLTEGPVVIDHKPAMGAYAFYPVNRPVGEVVASGSGDLGPGIPGAVIVDGKIQSLDDLKEKHREEKRKIALATFTLGMGVGVAFMFGSMYFTGLIKGT